MKTKLSILCIALFSFCFVHAQTGVYKTYEDFLKGNIETMDDEVHSNENTFGITIKFKSTEGKTVKYKPKEMWGFLFKGNLFRSVDNDIAFVADTGKVCFYENGSARLSMIINDWNKSSFIRGTYCYISSDLNSKVYDMPYMATSSFVSGNNKQYKKFKEENPQQEKLYDCIDKSIDYKKMRQCVNEYNKSR